MHVALHRSLVNCSLRSQTSRTRIIHTSSTLPRLLHPFKYSSPEPVIDNNYWPGKIRYNNVTKFERRESNHADSGTGVPIKINVVSPRPAPKPETERPLYHVACQVPYEDSDKYQLHRIDPSFNSSPYTIRPTILKVVVPAENTYDSQRNIRPEPILPNVVENYPVIQSFTSKEQ